MLERKSLMALCVVCALAISAVAASSASAAGYTAFTCKKVGAGGEFNKAHCKKADKVGGEWSHAALTTQTNTAVTGTNGNNGPETKTTSVQKLKGKIAGLETEIQCTGLASENGTLSNKETAGGEMYVHAESKWKYTGCTVVKPAGRGCIVTGGTITTVTLTGTSEGQGMNFLVKPKEGTEFTSLPISNCLNNIPPTANYPVSGSVKITEVEPEGATGVSTHAEVTTQGTLNFGGQPAGIDGEVTIQGPSGDGISVTTIGGEGEEGGGC